MRQERRQGPWDPLRKACDVTLGSHAKLYLGGLQRQGLWSVCISKVPCSCFYIVKMRDRDGSLLVLKCSAAA